MTDTSNNSSMSNDGKKTVSFAPQAAVYRTTHVNDYSNEEYDAVWYSPKEIDLVKAECALTVTMMQTCTSLHTEMYCSRGLEYRTPIGQEMRRMNKLNGLVAVLNEQDRQYDENEYDPDAIACIYKQVTQHCQDDAHQLALRDERYVRRDFTSSNHHEQENKMSATEHRKAHASPIASPVVLSPPRRDQRYRHDSSNRRIVMLAMNHAADANRIMSAAA